MVLGVLGSKVAIKISPPNAAIPIRMFLFISVNYIRIIVHFLSFWLYTPFMPKEYKTFGGHGVDVAEHRADDLDKLCLERLSQLHSPSVLDLGCGAGGQSVRMAHVAAKVLCVDEYDFSQTFTEHAKELPVADIDFQFVQSDLEQWIKNTDRSFNCVLFQRTIHYLPYLSALKVLQKLSLLTTDSLFISVTGLHSAVGNEYVGRETRIESRFFTLTPKSAKTFSITQPVCLYTKAEFKQLLEQGGWEVEKLWESAFGNSKAVCRPRV